MPINVDLTPFLEEMVRQKVNSGFYTSASEVVREALRLMAQQDTHRNAKLDQLLKDIHAGIDCGIVTAWDVEEIKRAVQKRRETKKAD